MLINWNRRASGRMAQILYSGPLLKAWQMLYGLPTGGGFGPDARPKGGNYMDGYRTTGYFFVWLRDHKDKEFLRKINRNTLEIVPWSFDAAIKHVLGEEYNIDELWREYQIAVGDL